MSKKQKIKKNKLLNSDTLTQEIRELQKQLRLAPVRTSQKHRNKKYDAKYRRRNKNY
jgi:hypothetical protein